MFTPALYQVMELCDGKTTGREFESFFFFLVSSGCVMEKRRPGEEEWGAFGGWGIFKNLIP